jgi:HAD superfamily hydrolase (TIGR01509 family)
VSAPVELVILDCDGVLVDSERLSIRIDAEVLADIGWPISEQEIVDRFLGRSDEYMRSEVSRHIGRELPADWDAPYSHLYVEAMRSELQPVDGIVDALDRIALPTCVASSGSHRKMRLTLGTTGLWDRFEGRIFSATEVAQGKPAPDLFLHAAERMGVPPERCAVVEDSRFGVQAARAAGMRALGYAGGLTSAESLAAAGAVTFDDMRSLPDLIAAA